MDLDSPDSEAYPLFAQAEYVECILGPGEMLYIPVSSDSVGGSFVNMLFYSIA